MRNYLKHLVQLTPTPIMEFAEWVYDLVPPERRYGRPYRDALSLFEESDDWSLDELRSYQEKRLRLLLEQCYANVPYYREVFREAGLTPDDIGSADDLGKLPILTKDTVRRRKQDLLAENLSAVGCEPAHTSGSTGTPLDFAMDRTTRAVERAFYLRRLRWLGFRRGDKLAFFQGRPLTDPTRLYRYFPGSRQLRISFHRSDEARLEQMFEALARFEPDFIDGWPSCLYILARWMERHNKSIPAPKYLVTGSETLYPLMREYIEKIFSARVIDCYGQEESVAVAAQCERAEGYHIQAEMGLVELIPCGEGLWEIVGTCLHNLAMPFVRYRTGDLAVKGEQECPCGRKHPVLSRIVGREGDFVLTPENNLISPLSLHFSFYHLDEISEGQIIQEDIDRLRVKVVPVAGISQATKAILIHELKSRLESPSMDLIVDVVEEIPRSSSGKKPFVISRLERQDQTQFASR